MLHPHPITGTFWWYAIMRKEGELNEKRGGIKYLEINLPLDIIKLFNNSP